MEHWDKYLQKMDEPLVPDQVTEIEESSTSGSSDDITSEEESSASGSDAFIRMLRTEEEITREQFSEMLDRGEVEYARVLTPGWIDEPENEMVEFARLLGISIDESESGISSDEFHLPSDLPEDEPSKTSESNDSEVL
ncbi:hypothetical protein HDV00_012786, partial [Rhizophlyctis rosea]